MTQKRKKVLIGANDLLVGGVQKLIIDQLQRLDRESFDFSLVTLFQFPNQGDFYELVPPGVDVWRLNFKNFWDVRSWMALVRVIRKVRPDIVKSSLFFSNIIFGCLQPFFGYRLIVAEHNTFVRKTKPQIFLNRILMHIAETMVVDSNMVADYLSQTEHIDRGRYTVIYNGIDIDTIARAKLQYGPHRESIRREFGLRSSDKVFLNVARLSWQKNHELMINAFARLNQLRNDCRLIIVGDGDNREPMREQIRSLGLDEQVLLVGERKRKDVETFYCISDFFLLTSRHEGFCITAMEGLAFGMPLLSTRVAGVSEYLKDGENGFFVDSDPADIAEKMNKVADFSEEQIHSFAVSGMETARAYSLERYIQAYRDMLSTSTHTAV
ncbi:MAG: glycosyltransferase family 4 protein [Candidatus Parcubacteria bacterium]|nr:glycosyltransferase family 4 protein [Candidatus Parcubacteria bacterium]